MERYAAKILTALATAALLGLAAWVWNTQGAVADLNSRIDRLVSRLDKQGEVDQTLIKFWRLHSWARARINEERQARSVPVAEWPDLE